MFSHQNLLKILVPCLTSSLILACQFPAANISANNETALVWECHQIAPGGRIDAVAYLGRDVFLAGTRNLDPGLVFRSTDAGGKWEQTAQISDPAPLGTNITCIASEGAGTAYILTGNSTVWKSTDWGQTWFRLAQVSKAASPQGYQRSYAMTVLDSGTILVSDTNASGGHVFRSTDSGSTWSDRGAISDKPVYRFQKVENDVLLNGWAGHVYKSQDDGLTWTDMGQLTDSPLYATEYLGHGICLQAAQSGEIFRSTDHGETWTPVGSIGDPADDFVHLGQGHVLCSTYMGQRRLHLSRDHGLTWQNLGSVPTGTPDDSLDHIIGVDNGAWRAVGGTWQGFIVCLTRKSSDDITAPRMLDN